MENEKLNIKLVFCRATFPDDILCNGFLFFAPITLLFTSRRRAMVTLTENDATGVFLNNELFLKTYSDCHMARYAVD